MKRNNKRALYESIMRKVSKEVKKALNEENDTYEDIVYEMENYFTPKMCRNIWETGKVSREFQADDDIYCNNPEDYKYETEYSQWKSSINMIQEAIQIVYDSYPGDMANDAKAAVKQLRTLEISDDIIDLKSKYSVKINNKNIPLFFNINDKYQSHITTLLQIPFIRRITNFMYWICKIEIQTYLGGQFFEKMQEEISLILRPAYKDNPDLSKKLLARCLMLPILIMKKKLDNIILNPSMIKESANFDDEWNNLDDEAWLKDNDEDDFYNKLNLDPIDDNKFDDYDDYDNYDEWDDTPDIDDLY